MKTDSTQMADDMTGDAGRDTGYESGDMAKDITLDKNVPEIADAFQGCKVGDTYTVKSDDDNELVLSKEPAATEAEEPPAEDGASTPGSDAAEPSSDNPAIAALIMKKSKS